MYERRKPKLNIHIIPMHYSCETGWTFTNTTDWIERTPKINQMSWLSHWNQRLSTFVICRLQKKYNINICSNILHDKKKHVETAAMSNIILKVNSNVEALISAATPLQPWGESTSTNSFMSHRLDHKERTMFEALFTALCL